MSRAAQTAINEYLRIGEALYQTKALVNHGGWGPFLETCEINQRTAQESMRLARHREQIEREAHGRTHVTIEWAKNLIADKARKPAGILKARRSEEAAHRRKKAVGYNDPPPSGSELDLGTQKAAPTTGIASVTPDGGLELETTRIEATVDEWDDTTIESPSDRDEGPGSPGPAGPPTDLPQVASMIGPKEDRNTEEAAEENLGLRPAPSEAENSDREWLDSMPLRDRLENPEVFDQQPLLWRHARPHLEAAW